MKLAAMFGSSSGAIGTAAIAAVVVVGAAVGITMTGNGLAPQDAAIDPDPPMLTPQAPPEIAALPEAVPDAAAPDPDPDPQYLAPRLDLVRVSPDGATVVAGRTSPDLEVALLLDGVEIELVTADGSGDFVALMTLPPSAAPRSLSAEARQGDLRLAGVETILIAPLMAPDTPAPAPEVPQPAPLPQTDLATAPDISTIQPDTLTAAPPDSTPVLLPAVNPAPSVVIAGPEGLRVVQGSGGGPAAQTEVRLDAISYDTSGAVQLSGRGPAQANLQVYLNNQPIQLGEIGPGGDWSLQLPDIDPGTYTLSVAEISDAGQTLSRVDTPFLREDPERIAEEVPEPRAAGIEVMTVQPGFTLWGIAEDTFGDGVQYVQIFEENRDQITDPNRIFPGQIFRMPDGDTASGDD